MNKTGSEVISVIGLGYVGLPVAVSFSQYFKTIGFDISTTRINELKDGFDRTNEVEVEKLKNPQLLLTSDPSELRQASFHIVTVPTPIDEAHRPDLRPIYSATETVGKSLKKGDVVVYESTVYPGVTEEECVPILEKLSGLKCGVDFSVGYSPERINPGDKSRRFETIKKVVSGLNAVTLDRVDQVYSVAVKAGTYRASSIKVAEAAKVIENAQRDINIAFVNELALIFDKMQIDTRDVLQAAGTKWNFLPFTPGLVGGHCIGVDPYYLTHKAESLGYHSEVILAGRRINDNMGNYVATRLIKMMIKKNQTVNNSKVLILGITFKENCPDSRNTRVIDVIRELKDFGCQVDVYDPHAIPEEVEHEYQVKLSDSKVLSLIPDYHSVVVAVAHNEFKNLSWSDLKSDKNIIFDLKGILPRNYVDGRL